LRRAVASDIADIQRIRRAVRENRLDSITISDVQVHDAMVEWLFSRGLGRLWLTTDPGTRAQRFYEAAGWEYIAVKEGDEVRYERSK
jgi:hypothetical protein